MRSWVTGCWTLAVMAGLATSLLAAEDKPRGDGKGPPPKPAVKPDRPAADSARPGPQGFEGRSFMPLWERWRGEGDRPGPGPGPGRFEGRPPHRPEAKPEGKPEARPEGRHGHPEADRRGRSPGDQGLARGERGFARGERDGRPQGPPPLREIFARLDRDHDGKLSFEEFAAGAGRMMGVMQQRFHAHARAEAMHGRGGRGPGMAGGPAMARRHPWAAHAMARGYFGPQFSQKFGPQAHGGKPGAGRGPMAHGGPGRHPGMGPGPHHGGFGPGPQAFGRGPGGFGPGPQAFGRGPGGFGPGPQAFGRGPGGFGPGPQAFGRGPGEFGPGPRGMGPGPFAFHADQRGAGECPFCARAQRGPESRPERGAAAGRPAPQRPEMGPRPEGQRAAGRQPAELGPWHDRAVEQYRDMSHDMKQLHEAVMKLTAEVKDLRAKVDSKR